MVTIGSIHSRFLTNDTSALKPDSYEMLHYTQLLHMFNKKLNSKIEEADRDPLFATATLLNGITFNGIETKTPEEAWPLAESSKDNDLKWLAMQKGIPLVIRLVNPFRQGGMFRHVWASDHSPEGIMQEKAERARMVMLAQDYIRLCEVSITDTPATNPYVIALRSMAPLLNGSCRSDNVTEHLGFAAELTPEFLQLLREKEHRALLLMATWYSGVMTSEKWWLVWRARVECTSICMYLNRHSRDELLRRLLKVPASVCGVAVDPLVENVGGFSPANTDESFDSMSSEPAPLVPGNCTPM